MIKIKTLVEKVTPKYKIYCDLDSVLSDFDTAFNEISDVKMKTGWDYRNKFGEEKLWSIIEKAGLKFWTDMPWMSGGKKLWNYLKNTDCDVIILSAPPSKLHEQATAKKGKLIWCKKHLGSDTKVIVEKQKYKYARKNTILIDDREKNTVPWKQHGGIAILYKSADDTIRRLKELDI